MAGVRASLLTLALLAGCAPGGHADPLAAFVPGAAGAAEADAPDVFPVPRPPFSEGIFPCSRCHAGGAEVRDERPGFTHRSHVERGLECTDCHGEEAAAGEPRMPDASACEDCHEDLSEASERAQAYFATVTREDGTLEFSRRWTTRDTRPAHPQHAAAGVECTACHGEIGDAFEKPRSVPLMERCVACHEQRDAPDACETCHVEIRERAHAKIVLHHAEDQRGCLDCHTASDRDVLHLANGTRVPFEESWRVCGQCHGPRLRDWKLGLHGKRLGSWNGRKEYLLCAHCHDPHSPRFPAMEPVPQPYRPEEVR